MNRRSSPLVAVAAVFLIAGAAGCSGDDEATDPVSSLYEATPTLETEPAYPQVPREEANVIVMTTHAGDKPMDLDLRLGAAPLVDITLPGCPQCHDDPVYSYAFDLPEGPVALVANAGDGTRAATPLHVDDKVQWVVVSTQDGFPVDVMVSRVRPLFG